LLKQLIYFFINKARFPALRTQCKVQNWTRKRNIEHVLIDASKQRQKWPMTSLELVTWYKIMAGAYAT